MYLFPDGYSSLIDALAHDVRDLGGATYLDHELVSFETDSEHVHLRFKNGWQIFARHVVLALPSQVLLSTLECDFTPDERTMLQNVQPVSLTRLFGQYDMSLPSNDWMHTLRFSTLDSPLRQLIPIRPSLGLFQVSYSDNTFADFWGRLPLPRARALVQKLLQEILPTKTVGDAVLGFWRFFWSDAIHFWKPWCNEEAMSRQIRFLRRNVSIVGESYSLNQGWAEGAVQTTVDVANHLLRN
jgi:hypothetical protein